ncbi:hypothetical protein MRX96_046270 [Rhipicephalus microplus]
MTPCPMPLNTGSPCQLSLLAKVDSASFRVRVMPPTSLSSCPSTACVPFLRSRLASGSGLQAWASIMLTFEDIMHGSSMGLAVKIVLGGRTRILNSRVLKLRNPFPWLFWCKRTSDQHLAYSFRL